VERPDDAHAGHGDLIHADLELLERRTLDGHTPELVYRPTPR
jgi:hypothetical protein